MNEAIRDVMQDLAAKSDRDIIHDLQMTIEDLKVKNTAQSVTTDEAGDLTDCEPLEAVYSTDSLTTFRWSTT